MEKLTLSVYLDNFKSKSKQDIVEDILSQVNKDNNGKYSGYEQKDWLKEFLYWSIFGMNQEEQFDYDYDSDKEAKLRIEVDKLGKELTEFIKNPVSINIFPALDSFTINEMGGCAGFCPSKNTIVILINFISDWETSLREAIVHELAHAVSDYYSEMNNSIGESLILDGIAEHFREAIIGGKRAPWTEAITREGAEKLMVKVKDIIEVRDQKVWQELFFGCGKYPKWAGYSIGYYMIEDYLKDKKNVDWKTIIATDPNIILKETLKLG